MLNKERDDRNGRSPRTAKPFFKLTDRAEGRKTEQMTRAQHYTFQEGDNYSVSPILTGGVVISLQQH